MRFTILTPAIKKQWGERVMTRLGPAIVETLPDGSVKVDTSKPEWFAFKAEPAGVDEKRKG